MREKLELRVGEEVFSPYIRNYAGFQRRWLAREIGFVKVIQGYSDDPMFMAFIDYLRSKVNYHFVYIKREYKPSELAAATLLEMNISAAFEPTGEECGTEYIEKCHICKAGRAVKDKLVLDLTKVPKAADIAKTIAQDEWIVSDGLASLMREHKISGMELKPVEHYTKRETKKRWHQLVLTSIFKVSSKTTYGEPFQPNLDVNKYRSTCGHTVEALPYSEFFIEQSSWDGSDMARTNLYFAGHINLVYPWPGIFISQRLYRLLKENNIKGYRVEVAHLV